MNKIRFGLLATIARGLEAMPPTQFDFRHLIRDFDPVNGCGTVCCAIGWFPRWFPKDWKWGDMPAIEEASDYLGLTLRQAEKLFLPYQSGLGGDATPTQVAAHIRAFVNRRSPRK